MRKQMNMQQLTIKWADDCKGQYSADCIGAAINIIQSVSNYATPEYRAQIKSTMLSFAEALDSHDKAKH